MSRISVLVSVLVALLWSERVQAEARFVIQARGNGFSDPTAVAPEGGNNATTLGEQRKAVVQYAADLWGARLESSVPIVLDVVFSKRGCGENAAVLAGARAVGLFSGMNAPGADPALWYPSPLANRLAGRDLDPDEPDIRVLINSSIDAECRTRFRGFYYGFDGEPGGRVDLVETLLHELGHGLGFSSFIDLESGMPEEGGVDVFSAHILDIAAKKTWNELSNEERRASALKVRGLAFQGANTTKAAAELLAKGSPALSLSPAVAGFVGAVGETGTSYSDMEGPVRLAGSFEGCVTSTAGLSGALVLIRPDCMGTGQLAPRLIGAGAAGALIFVPSDYAEPAVSDSLWGTGPGVPSLIVSGPDAELMRMALSTAPLRARVHWDATRLTGADGAGRPLLFASQPADPGSSVSHFEPLARPDLLMEPFSSDTVRHTFDLTWPTLMDLGWTPRCGNHQLDAGETCDDGDANSDLARDACRKTCLRASCGDGVLDTGEACDSGKANSDSVPNACRTTCVVARCGDAIVDTDEGCDQGASNDDARPNACRKDCRRARCGDGIVDDGEQCDGTGECSPTCMLVMRRDDTMPTNEEDGGPDNESVWIDPWDAPGSDKPRSRSDGCSALMGTSAHHGTALGFLLMLGLSLARRRGLRASDNARRTRP